MGLSVMRTLPGNYLHILSFLYFSNAIDFKSSVLMCSLNISIHDCDDLWMNGLIEWHFMPYDPEPTIWLTPKGLRHLISKLPSFNAPIVITISVPKIKYATVISTREQKYMEALMVIASNTALNGIACMKIAEYALKDVS